MFGYVVTLMKFGEANLEMSQERRNSQLPVCPLVLLDRTRAAIVCQACAVPIKILIYRNVSRRDICDYYKKSIFREGAMVIDILRQEHRNIESLLLVLERELSLFARGERPDYDVVHT